MHRVNGLLSSCGTLPGPAGSIALSGVRINSLDLVRQLAGTASIVVETGEGAQGGTVAVRARGTAAGASSSSAAGGLGAADVLDLQLGVGAMQCTYLPWFISGSRR